MSEDLLQTIEDGPPLDQYGRYVLPDPSTGEERGWTRVSTMAQTLSDKFGLARWEARLITHGLGQRPDLVALAHSTELTDSKALDQIAGKALAASRADVGANHGTAVHQWTAQLDAGQSVGVPRPFHTDVAAYRAALTLHELEVMPDFIERIVICPGMGCVGTLDRLVIALGDDGGHYVLDVKTIKSRNLAYSWGEIAIQLALYANASHAWDSAQRRWLPMPKGVSRSKAIVAHIPIGEERCDLYDVDIERGWRAAQLALDVRNYRKLGRKLSGPHSSWVDTSDRIRRANSITELRQILTALTNEGRLKESHKDAIRSRMAELTNQAEEA